MVGRRPKHTNGHLKVNYLGKQKLFHVLMVIHDQYIANGLSISKQNKNYVPGFYKGLQRKRKESF